MKSKRFSIRTTIFSLLLATALWCYVNLRTSYEIVTSIPLEVHVASGRSIENPLPQYLSVKLRATGWHLLNILYFGAGTKTVVNVDPRHKDYTFSEDELKSGFSAPVRAEILEIQPQSISVRTGEVMQKKVPVLLALNVEVADGYTMVGVPQYKPDSVTIRGNASLLQTINEWNTQKRLIANVRESQAFYLPLSDSLRNIIDVEPQGVQISTTIERQAELEIHDIPLEIAGAPPRHEHILSPERISLTVRGGVNRLAELNASSFHALVEYARLKNDSTGILKATIVLPANVQLLNVSPSMILHKIRPATMSLKNRPSQKSNS